MRPTPLDLFWVALGGGAGSLARWGVGLAVGQRQKGTFPIGTLLVNVSGAFVIGFLSILIHAHWRDRFGTVLTAGVLTGVLGGYTTFSSMQLDAVKLAEKGKPGGAAFYLAASVLLGLAAAALGAALARL